jgi:hypothetical protein
MGTITRSLANNITTGGVLLPASLVNNSIANVTAYNAAVATGGMKLISSQTASNSASISFTTGIDSTYKEYQFWFLDIHPRSDVADFSFNMSTDGGSNYNVAKTTTLFYTYNVEAGGNDGFAYGSFGGLFDGTGFQMLAGNAGSDADQNISGLLTLFNPASTTYTKNFTSLCAYSWQGDGTESDYVAGYGNTTSAVNAVQFKMDSGNFDGTILMFGIV